MPLSKIDSVYIKKDVFDRYYQGDILRDIKIVEWADEVYIEEDIKGEKHKEKNIEIRERIIPYSVIVTQDCDLEQDYDNRKDKESADNDKYIHTILLCQAHLSEKLRGGTHLEELKIKTRHIPSAEWKQLIHNHMYRYHSLEEAPDLQMPSLIIDFKHYFSILRNVLYTEEYSNRRIATISALFRDNLSIRYAQYLSRIGLPDFPKVTQAV